jgi:hypothetical protein
VGSNLMAFFPLWHRTDSGLQAWRSLKEADFVDKRLRDSGSAPEISPHFRRFADGVPGHPAVKRITYRVLQGTAEGNLR